MHTRKNGEPELPGQAYLIAHDQVPATEMLLSLDSLNFKSVVVGCEATLTFAISNPGDSHLKVEELHVPQHFTVAPALPWTVPPRGQVCASVTFRPDAEGEFDSVLVINGPENPPSLGIYLYGRGVLHGSPSQLQKKYYIASN